MLMLESTSFHSAIDDERYYSMREICVYLGVCRDSAMKWIAHRGLPAHKIGNRWRFKKSEVDAWVHSGMADVNYKNI